VAYNLQNFLNVELKGAYNSWSVDNEQQAWNKPTYEAQLKHEFKNKTMKSVYPPMLFTKADGFAKLGNTAISMHDKLDINLGGTYVYNSWLTALYQNNNLINSQYQDYYGYDVQGINFMIGAAVKF